MLPEIPNKIFLTGFMASGKSSVARHLARLIQCPCIDLDEQIVLHEGRSINDIFAQEGETYFRNCETEFLQSLKVDDAGVYATGGGIVLRDENRQLMHDLGFIVYLRSSWQVVRRRLVHSKARPLARHDQGWAPIEKLYQDRQPLYLDADIVIDSDQHTPPEIAESIYKILREGQLK